MGTSLMQPSPPNTTTPRERELAELRTRQDKAFADLAHYRETIERIAMRGPDNRPFDRAVVELVFTCVAGELALRRAQAATEPT